MSMKNQRFRSKCKNAARAFGAALDREASLRVHVAALICLIIVLASSHTPLVWCGILLSFAVLVICLELINSAVEAFCDHVSPGLHPEIAFVKDCASASVLIASIGSLVAFGLYILS